MIMSTVTTWVELVRRYSNRCELQEHLVEARLKASQPVEPGTSADIAVQRSMEQLGCVA
jgi:hypothetical protein